MRKPISIEDFSTKSFSIFDKGWFLLSSGDFSENKYNTMTISWGGLGTMWHKPIVMVVIRPGRYTFSFINQYDSFTVNAFSEKYRPALNMLGSRSGRVGDKIKASGLTPTASLQVAAPSFAEAYLSIECKKIYYNDFVPSNFLVPDIERQYPQKDYHRMFFGEVLYISME